MTYSSGDFQGSDFEAVLARQEAHLEVNEEVRSTFYDSVVEMFELDLSVLPGFSGTDHYYFTNFIIPKAAIFPNVGDAFESGEKVKWRRSETSSVDQEYEPIPIIATGFDRTTKGQIPQPELQVSNIFGTLSGGTRKGLHVGARNSMVYQGHYSVDGASASGTLSANVWYHIVWTYDVSASEMKMYLNGSHIETDTGKGSFLGTTSLRIGLGMSDRYANIDLAYAKVFDSILSTSKISSLYSDYDSIVTRSGYIYGTVNENGTLNFSAPANATITSVSFASYGTPNGSDGNYTTGSCHATNSQTIVESYCVGNNSCSIPASNGVFGDPCGGTLKRLYVKLYYTH